MGYWTKYKCVFCGEIMIGDEENIEHVRTCLESFKHN